ncbi:hypothetical protein GJ496_003538 [Pomphorhynchus laevis]|nr:hypothetical protein GJ496_003538 [Pomphorhynchus laevis]
MNTTFPVFVDGIVVHGLNRANVDKETVSNLCTNLTDGVYFGYARVDYGPTYRSLISVGNNPQFKGVTRSFEVHILHEFEEDFYSSRLRTVVVGKLRSMMAYESIQGLIKAIASDIADANRIMDKIEEKELEKYTMCLDQLNNLPENGISQP